MWTYPLFDPVAIAVWTHPQFDPVAIAIGPLKVHWYGLTYLVGFLAGWWLGNVRAVRSGGLWSKEQVSDLLVYIVIGIVLGGRLGYVLFYQPGYYMDNPLRILAIWSGGMSFHGGLLGVLIALWWYGRRGGRSFLAVADFVAPLVPVGLGAGRLGNFINQELWGRPTDLPWGIIMPRVDELARHPSPLYQATLEGLVLFVVLWVYSSRPRTLGRVSALFLIVYSVFRFGVEFVREPDRYLNFIAFGWLTMGQLLTVPMLLLGLYLWWFAPGRNATR